MSNQIKSVSVSIGPVDRRCRYWAKIVRAGTPLPLPSAANGANDVPGPYLRNGDDELFVGDVMIQGEEMHHRKNRGWSYAVTFIGSNGAKVHIINPDSDVKAALKAAGIRPELLAGSGGIAACVRVAQAMRDGIRIERYTPPMVDADTFRGNRPSVTDWQTMRDLWESYLRDPSGFVEGKRALHINGAAV